MQTILLLMRNHPELSWLVN